MSERIDFTRAMEPPSSPVLRSCDGERVYGLPLAQRKAHNCGLIFFNSAILLCVKNLQLDVLHVLCCNGMMDALTT